jgi:multidrug efflux system membrane fusion protein
VLSGAPGNYVYLVEKNDTVSVHKVTLGPSDGKNTVITGGLNVGDSVVTQGTDRLNDGTKITIATPPAPQKSSASGSPAKTTGVGDTSPAGQTNPGPGR